MNASPGNIFQEMISIGGYMTTSTLATLINITKRAVRERIKKGRYTQVKQTTGNGSGRGGKIWLIHISDPAVPNKIKIAYYEVACAPHAAGDKAPFQAPGPAASISQQAQAVLPEPASFSTLSDKEIDAEIYSAAPAWAREKADKYIMALKESEGLRGEDLRKFVASWNHKHPEIRTSYDSILEARQKYIEEGLPGLLSKYGKAAGKTKVADGHYEYFKGLYLKEGGPSVHSCWITTLGCAKTINPKLETADFPSQNSFLRRLGREIPEDAIFLARRGKEAWKRKYGDFINRDYSRIQCGECAVSDHAQVDVAVKLPNGKVCFPWITAWRDFKSGKWLGWRHHPEAPNSDHIFQSFYYAVDQWGIFNDALIDNGKDYKVRDFAGGWKYHKVNIDESMVAPMLLQIGVTPHFALPYNAQTKSIERDFLKNKEWFSKYMPGYRGGNVRERPEKLKQEIKSGSILTWDEYTKLMDDFIINVLNKMPSAGKVLKGLCPDELWQKEKIEIRRISRDALKLFCMRTSENVSIGRNGIKESSLDAYYWAEWMAGRKGTRVYMRRDPQSWQVGWVFEAGTHEYLGKAELTNTVPALARTDIEREQVKEAIRANRQREKIIKSYIEIKDAPSPSEIITQMAAGIAATKKLRGYEPEPREKKEVKIITADDTAMDKVIRKEQELLREGTYDLGIIRPHERKTKKIRLFECE